MKHGKAKRTTEKKLQQVLEKAQKEEKRAQHSNLSGPIDRNDENKFMKYKSQVKRI